MSTLEKQEEKIIEDIDYAFVLNEILQKVNSHCEHIDVQVNIIVALSTAVFIFSAQRFLLESPKQPLYLLALILFSALSAIAGLLAVNPPGFMRKKGQKESLLYHRRIALFNSAEEYAERLETMLSSKRNITEGYSSEIYNLSKYYYLPKRSLFQLSRNLLMLGLTLSFILFIVIHTV
ncbi:MAG TPA: Pycsar system effector family protein [Candidatus Saccharimonadales bacterium]|nr:Pycsar system effector family protein [Candidatus Saccharimonadales bacterium]